MQFEGVGVALVTPFLADGSVDAESLESLVRFVVENGADFLVPLGTTGESATLSLSEQEACLALVLETNNCRLPVLVGCGGNKTDAVAERMRLLRGSFKFDGFLSVAPYYLKPTQYGLQKHYSRIAEAAELPVMLYNVPSRTGCNLLPETALQLAKEHGNIVGIKEASGSLDQSMELIDKAPVNFTVLSGDDKLALPLIACGARGCISVVANAEPRAFSQLVRSGMEGDFASARSTHYALLELFDLLFEEGNPAGIKALLECDSRVASRFVRLPLMEASEELYGKISKAREKLLESAVLRHILILD